MRPPFILFILPLFLTYYSSAQQSNPLKEVKAKNTQIKADSTSTERKFTCRVVRTEAKFEDGPDDWEKYLRQNINYDLPTQNGCLAGKYTVRINFALSKEGIVTYTKATTNFGYEMEHEVMRVISLSPKWTPATQNGRIVSAYLNQLITFDVCESANVALFTRN
jgi:hypothetical protein